MSKDNWCDPLHRKNKQTLYGGAARNVRISKSGGMNEIIGDSIRNAFQKADLLASSSNRQNNVIQLKRKSA